jgi:hypothetical protein
VKKKHRLRHANLQSQIVWLQKYCDELSKGNVSLTLDLRGALEQIADLRAQVAQLKQGQTFVGIMSDSLPASVVNETSFTFHTQEELVNGFGDHVGYIDTTPTEPPDPEPPHSDLPVSQKWGEIWGR